MPAGVVVAFTGRPDLLLNLLCSVAHMGGKRMGETDERGSFSLAGAAMVITSVSSWVDRGTALTGKALCRSLWRMHVCSQVLHRLVPAESTHTAVKSSHTSLVNSQQAFVVQHCKLSHGYEQGPRWVGGGWLGSEDGGLERVRVCSGPGLGAGDIRPAAWVCCVGQTLPVFAAFSRGP